MGSGVGPGAEDEEHAEEEEEEVREEEMQYWNRTSAVEHCIHRVYE
jgi:hypothetical protein